MATTKKITRMIVAIALGVMVTVGAFAFKADINSSNKAKLADSYWFSTLTNGTPVSPLAGDPECSDPSGDYCARLYHSDEITFDGSGNPISVTNGNLAPSIQERYKD